MLCDTEVRRILLNKTLNEYLRIKKMITLMTSKLKISVQQTKDAIDKVSRWRNGIR